MRLKSIDNLDSASTHRNQTQKPSLCGPLRLTPSVGQVACSDTPIRAVLINELKQREKRRHHDFACATGADFGGHCYDDQRRRYDKHFTDGTVGGRGDVQTYAEAVSELYDIPQPETLRRRCLAHY